MLRTLIVALIAGAPLAGAAPAHAHGAIPEPPALAPAAPDGAEAKLRRIETEQLGAAHAAVHAFQRQLAARESEGGVPKRKADAPSTALRGSPRTAAAPARAPDEGGGWAQPDTIPVIAMNTIMLPTGKVLMFGYPGRPGEPGSNYQNLARAYVWDPVTKLSKQIDPPIDPATGQPTNIWCGGASLLADGRVLVTGGNVDDPTTNFHGIDVVFTFDPFLETWQVHKPMRQGRWYPTQVLMPDGRTLILGGLTKPGDPDYGNPASAVGGTDNDLEIFSPDGSLVRDGLRFNNPGGPPIYALYPRMFWMPSGRALAVGPYASDTWFLHPAPAGGGTSTWSEIPNLSRDREFGTAVLLSGGRVMTLGGSPQDDPGAPGTYRPATTTTEVFDENAAQQGWTPGADMAVARSHANSVLLPDGRVATVGGGFGDDGSTAYYRWQFSDDQKRVELYDPGTGAPPVLGPAQTEGRTYHSTALLLPDARVMSAGDDINGRPDATHPNGAGTGINTDTAEIYSPPYLFRKDGSGEPAPRPGILSVPAAVQPGDRFEVDADGPAATRAVLVAPGAATHAFDMSQRLIDLEAPQPGTDGRIALRMPGNPNIAPPGYYMLFLLSADDVPSIARFVRLDPHAPPQPRPAVAPAAAPPPPPPAQVMPKLRVTGRLPSLRTLRRTRRFSVMVALSEPGKVVLSALLDRGKKPGLPLARRRTTFSAPARRRVTFTLTRTGLRRLSRLRRGVLRIRAVAQLDSGRPLPVSHTRRRLR